MDFVKAFDKLPQHNYSNLTNGIREKALWTEALLMQMKHNYYIDCKSSELVDFLPIAWSW